MVLVSHSRLVGFWPKLLLHCKTALPDCVEYLCFQSAEPHCGAHFGCYGGNSRVQINWSRCPGKDEIG